MSAATTPSREQLCQKHNGRLYFQIYLAGAVEERLCWVGDCDLCREEATLEREAREILSKRDTEKRKRIAVRHMPGEEQIKQETDAEIERRAQAIVDDMESYRPEFEAEVRRRHWETGEREVEAEMLKEITDELKKEKR